MLSLAQHFHHYNDKTSQPTPSTHCSASFNQHSYYSHKNAIYDEDDDDMMFYESEFIGGDDRFSLYHQTCLRYEDIEMAGPPVQALDFPSPTIHRAIFTSGRILDHRSGRIHEAMIMMKLQSQGNMMNAQRSDRAYLVRRKLSKTGTGSVRVCTVLRRRMTVYDGHGNSKSAAEWKTTDENVVLKASPWSMLQFKRGKGYDDPLKNISGKSHIFNNINAFPQKGLLREAASLQYVGNYHANVLGCIECLQDDTCLYVLMPYINGGSLYSRITSGDHGFVPVSSRILDNPIPTGTIAVEKRQPQQQTNQQHVDYQHEERVRGWFRQLLQALSHLQKKGVCHNDLCLENILLVDDRNIVISDFGSSLRIPYDDEANIGFISDVSQGYQRRLIKASGQNGRLSYLAPEIIEGDDGFDGFAVDLWSAGVILFICLVGSAPFKWSHSTDCHYSMISQGKLHTLVKEFDIAISDEACDLLQNMFWRNPRRRLILSDICSHPWVIGRGSRPPSPSTAAGPTRHSPIKMFDSQTSSHKPPLIPSMHSKDASRHPNQGFNTH